MVSSLDSVRFPGKFNLAFPALPDTECQPFNVLLVTVRTFMLGPLQDFNLGKLNFSFRAVARAKPFRW